MSEQEGPAFRMLPIDQKVARRQGLPFNIPIPEAEFEGLADEGLKAEKLELWIRSFLENAPVAKDGTWRRRNSTLVSQLEGFIDKKPLWEKAEKMFAANDFEAALRTIKRITMMMPDDHAARLNYANALANQQQYDKAYKQLKQIRETFMGEPDYHVTVAQVHVALEDQEAAIGELVMALETKPDHRGAMDALAKLGVLARIYENPRDAASLTYVRSDAVLEYISGHWDSAERDAAYYVEQMGYHESEERFEVALEAANRAIKSSGGAAVRAHIGKAAALRHLDRAEDALAAARTFVELAPDAASAHLELSKSLAKLGKSDEATQALDAALARDPGDQEALVYKLWPKDRGDMQAVQGAMSGIQAWADAHPTVAGSWRSLARAKLAIESRDDALSLFHKAVTLAPDDDDLRSEWWGELAQQLKYKEIIEDSEKLGNMSARDWKLRWNEAEAYRGLKRMMEARAVYMQINADDALHIDIRKRAKRAAMELGLGAPQGEGNSAPAAGEAPPTE